MSFVSKSNFHKVVTANERAILALSYKIVYKIAKCKKPHNITEQLITSAAIAIAEIMLGESYTKQFNCNAMTDAAEEFTISARI